MLRRPEAPPPTNHPPQKNQPCCFVFKNIALSLHTHLYIILSSLMKMKQPYNAPDVAMRRILLEANIAVAVAFSGQAKNWTEDEIVGDSPEEGGDLYTVWN
jgi:hypothetical protein